MMEMKHGSLEQHHGISMPYVELRGKTMHFLQAQLSGIKKLKPSPAVSLTTKSAIWMNSPTLWSVTP